jgi:Ca-activated chloride channel homolog
MAGHGQTPALWQRVGTVCGVLVGVMLSLGVIGGCAQSAPVGVTAGGQQDIASARQAIQTGEVPDPAAITIEGFISEHAIPIAVPDNAEELYAVASAAWQLDFDAFTPLATIQVGFGSTIDQATFTREPLNVGIVIDRSGSMADVIDDRSGTTKLDAVKIAVDRLLAQLDDNDWVSLTTFTTGASTSVEGVLGTDIAAIKTALDEVVADGGTDLANGLLGGFRAVQRQSEEGRMDRIIVFTDAELTERSESRVQQFLSVMEDFADRGIGATLFGVGESFGNEVAFDISQVRGGNYFFLSDYERIVSVFDEEFDFLVTPVAYDVTMRVDIPFEFDVVDVFGIVAEEPFSHSLELKIPTLFLSGREGGGAVFVRTRAGALVDFETESVLADWSFEYTTRDGEVIAQDSQQVVLPAGVDPSGDHPYYENDATRRGVLLLNTALTLKAVLEDVFSPFGYRYRGSDDQERAVSRVIEFLDYFDALAEGLNDQASSTSRKLSDERTLLEDLLATLQGVQ